MNEPPDTVCPPAERAFAEFYRLEAPGQMRRAALIVGDRELAGDLVHDAFIAVYRRWGSIADPGPYLSATVLNACRDATRRAGRHRTLLARHAAAVALVAPAADATVGDDEVWPTSSVAARAPSATTWSPPSSPDRCVRMLRR